MPDIKNRVQGVNPNIEARSMHSLVGETENIYESIVIMSSRARQLAVDIKEELHGKLEEFATTTDTIEEVHENKEQIEISKFYERLPNPAVISINEFVDDKIDYRYRGDEIVEAETSVESKDTKDTKKA